MIDVKQAVQIAKDRAVEMLDISPADMSLEEIERETYNHHDAWSITLSYPLNMEQQSPFATLTGRAREYKRLLIDAETGEFLAMKLREVASR